jgi:hypothetical protein
VVAELLRDDLRRVLLGEDVRDGGMLGLSRAAMQDPGLGLRVLATPLTPTANLAHATGLALAGRRPIVLLASASALLEGYAALRELGRIGGDGGRRAGGAGVDRGADRPGLRPRRRRGRLAGGGDRRGAGAAGGRARRPRRGAGEPAGGGQLRRRRGAHGAAAAAGDDLARARGARVQGPARASARGGAGGAGGLGGHGVCDRCGDRRRVHGGRGSRASTSAIVEISGLAPLDEAGVLAAATGGKLVVAHAGGRAHGVGAELAALLADRAILHLDAPVLRVTGGDGPFTGRDEFAGLPSVEAIAAAITRVATY